LDGLKSLLIIGKRFNISIRIARFSGLITAIFKLCGVCKKGIYYSIDYYSVSGKVVWFDRVFMVISEIAERFTIYMCDETWDISHRIPQARKEFGGINERSYSSKHAVVPLGYSEAFFRNKPVPVEKSIVFAGVVVEGQGLELILEILSELSSEFPGIKIKVIGTGPYLPAFKRKVTELSLDRYFTFYGFIEKVDDMLEIISSSHIGISLWDEKKNGLNFYYGDPGKTKLYSVCGLPVIVSNRTVYSQVVSDNHCGIAIDYEKAKLLNAIKSLLGDENKYRDYKSNAVKTAREYCSAEKIFSKVLEPL
jgi:glycosyltransferase involved in cell wall biosynthesis